MPSLGLAAAARAVPDDALRCQSAIGAAGRAYAVARLRAFVACNNDIASGRSCDVLRRDRIVARAAGALARTTAKACGDVALETLHFPGRCSDGNGGGFALGDLHHCIETSHDGAIDDALSFEYPNLRTFAGDERRCQRGLARAASAFIATDMRIRLRCLEARLGGSLPENVDCLALLPPHGPGTGDAATDHAVMQTTDRLMNRLNEACEGADLAHVGFPGRCLEFLGGELDLGYVDYCVWASHVDVPRLMLGVEYPPAVSPTPTPRETPRVTPTPRPVSLHLLPVLAQKPVGSVQNYTARAHMNDGNDRNFTQRVHYSSSDESVAVCPNAEGNRGRVLTVGPGTALITAIEPITGVATSESVTLIVAGCVHPKCVVGQALASVCDPCVTTICAADPSCCADAWGQACVDAVSSLCAETCSVSADG